MATLADALRQTGYAQGGTLGTPTPVNSPMTTALAEHIKSIPQKFNENQQHQMDLLARAYPGNTFKSMMLEGDPAAMNELAMQVPVVGMTKSALSAAERFLLAQKNAALPVSEGGLGLAANNTAAQRAKALGYDTPAYHGTRIDFEEFQPKSWFSSDPKYASDYSNVKMRVEPEVPTQQVLPVLTKIVKPHKVPYFGSEADMNKILDAGKKQTYVIENVGGGDTSHYVIKDPKNIRSVNAAFDPKRANEANILAAGLAIPMTEEKKTRKQIIEEELNKKK